MTLLLSLVSNFRILILEGKRMTLEPGLINCFLLLLLLFVLFYEFGQNMLVFKCDRLIRVGQRTRDRAKWNSIMLAAYTGTRWTRIFTRYDSQ